ncbi:MAG: hypothetical protein AB8G15_19970 [Saprospiraceae bacterium]
MKNFKELKESGTFELLDSMSQKTLKGGNNQFLDGCPPPYNNPKLAVIGATGSSNDFESTY